MAGEMNILAMAKGGERYVFLYDDASHDALEAVFDKFARNPDLNFSSDDAAMLSQKVEDCRHRVHRRRFPLPYES
jgi:hypothetical protein